MSGCVNERVRGILTVSSVNEFVVFKYLMVYNSRECMRMGVNHEWVAII